MLSSSDLPACPACGSRTVRPVHKQEEGGGAILATFYACSQCGSDRTQAWTLVQPPKTAESPDRKGPHRLGIGGTANTGDDT